MTGPSLITAEQNGLYSGHSVFGPLGQLAVVGPHKPLGEAPLLVLKERYGLDAAPLQKWLEDRGATVFFREGAWTSAPEPRDPRIIAYHPVGLQSIIDSHRDALIKHGWPLTAEGFARQAMEPTSEILRPVVSIAFADRRPEYRTPLYAQAAHTYQQWSRPSVNPEPHDEWIRELNETSFLGEVTGMKVEDPMVKMVTALRMLGFQTTRSSQGSPRMGSPYPWLYLKVRTAAIDAEPSNTFTNGETALRTRKALNGLLTQFYKEHTPRRGYRYRVAKEPWTSRVPDEFGGGQQIDAISLVPAHHSGFDKATGFRRRRIFEHAHAEM